MLINGQNGQKFKIQEGVRQGDPVSLYLFIQGADIRQQKIRRAHNTGFLLHPIQQGAHLLAL
jgi:hypothetical protein